MKQFGLGEHALQCTDALAIRITMTTAMMMILPKIDFLHEHLLRNYPQNGGKTHAPKLRNHPPLRDSFLRNFLN